MCSHPTAHQFPPMLVAECPLIIQGLPKLPDYAVCHLSEACNRVDCCIYSEFLDMTFNSWFELNCDLYLQAGMERLLSPKEYVLGGEINWDEGQLGCCCCFVLSGKIDRNQIQRGGIGDN